MKPPINYYGGKSRLGEWISSLFPPHDVYLEPFAGSAAVLFAKPPSRQEVMNDIDGNVVAFFRCLRDRPDELDRVCRLTPYARQEFLAADLTDAAIDDLERARRFWIRSTQAFGRLVAKENSWACSARRGGSEAVSTIALVDRFEAAASRLARVAIDNRPALDVIRRWDAPGVVIYADPPYLGSTRHGRAASYSDYLHDMGRIDQHEQLAETLKAAQSTVFLSGYHSPLYDQVYADWHRLERRVPKPSANLAGGNPRSTTVTEVVWSNRPLDQLAGLFDSASLDAEVVV